MTKIRQGVTPRSQHDALVVATVVRTAHGSARARSPRTQDRMTGLLDTLLNRKVQAPFAVTGRATAGHLTTSCRFAAQLS
jgi:hypothetical protein